MKSYHFMFVCFLAGILLLTACASATETTPPADQAETPSGNEGTSPSPYPASNEIYLPVTGSEPTYPSPETGNPVEPYPAVKDEPVFVEPDKVLKFSDLSPLASDKNLVNGPAFIEGSDLIKKESGPAQVELVIYGNLPTPCNQLRVMVSEPNANKQIDIKVYSVSDPEKMCIQVLEPFQTSIPLGDLSSGKYTILLNEEKAVEFSLP